jgi:Alr-MurF fusion protein
MEYPISELNILVKGSFLSYKKENVVNQLFIDTRTIIQADEGDLFIAITGKNNNGHKFINDAFSKGVRNFIVNDEPALSNLEKEITGNSNIILVENTVRAIQRLAAIHRKKFEILIIGITGSNGKTVIKEWLYQLLSQENRVYRSPKSFNSQIGVPLSVLGLNHSHELGIFEAGISTINEMENLEKIILPEIGVFTNIGQAHQEGFHSIVQKIEEKLLLFKNCKKLIYCKDYQILEEVIKQEYNEKYFSKNLDLFNWSFHTDSNLRIVSVDKIHNSSLIRGIFTNKPYSIEIPFTDPASIENAINCWLLLLVMGYNEEAIQKRMKQLIPVEMRLELKEGINNCTLINDSYNSDINSLGIALDFLNQQNQHKKKTVILSDLFQTGLGEKKLYNEVARIIRGKGVQKVIGIGEAMSRNIKRFGLKVDFYTTTREFIEHLRPDDFQNEAILIKGARQFEFEKITSVLQRKVHTTVLELNLQSIVNNLNVFRSYLHPETKIMAMVKAYSYGSGTFEIANVLQYHNVDYLAVAYADEGVDLRNNGINLPIMVMNPDKESFSIMQRHNLEPEIYSLNLFKDLVAFHQKSLTEKEFHIHLKFDTGMHRLGLLKEELEEFLKVLKCNEKIKVQSVFSHLASSENPRDDKFTLKQIQSFEEMSKLITGSLDYPVCRHILNSSGIIRFPGAQYDMVRLGLGLYGIETSGSLKNKLEPVGVFKTTVSQVKIVPPGQSIGYGRKTIVTAETKIAIIGVGYADGFHRSQGNGKGSVLVNGLEVPTIGNICMDMAMVDITGMEVREGDDVIIFGKGLTVEKVAERMNTIPYEVMTGISQRVKRIYYKE